MASSWKSVVSEEENTDKRKLQSCKWKKKTQLEVKQENDVKESLCYFCCSEVASWGMQGGKPGTEWGEQDLRLYTWKMQREQNKIKKHPLCSTSGCRSKLQMASLDWQSFHPFASCFRQRVPNTVPWPFLLSSSSTKGFWRKQITLQEFCYLFPFFHT